MPAPLTAVDLNLLAQRPCECGQVHQDRLTLRAACHPDGGADLLYHNTSGVILAFCHVCKTPIAKILVAGGGPHA